MSRPLYGIEKRPAGKTGWIGHSSSVKSVYI